MKNMIKKTKDGLFEIWVLFGNRLTSAPVYSILCAAKRDHPSAGRDATIPLEEWQKCG